VTDTKHQVRSYVIDNFLMGRQANDLTNDMSFLSKGILDSTGFLELIGFLEERFGIIVADEEMVPENLDTLNAIDAYLKRKADGVPCGNTTQIPAR
jgi:acyl carrier protein